MKVNPSPLGMPLSYYSNLYRVNQIPPVPVPVTLKKALDTTTLPYIAHSDNFPKDFLSSKLLSHLYSHFYPKLTEPSKYIIHHVDSDEKKDFSLFSMLNPFECETDESDEETDDYNGFIDSGEIFGKRKYKYLKKKKKKKLIKKKKIWIKFAIAFLVFLALKTLFEKFYYFFPTFFPSTAREELLEHMDDIFQEGFDSNRASDWNKAQQMGEHNRAIFAPNYEETRIDVRIPIQRRIISDS